MDELDAEYLKRLLEKQVKNHDGKSPLHQLSLEDLNKWDGVNIQGEALTAPNPQEDAVALYMIDADEKSVKRFTVTNAAIRLLTRKTARILYGTTNQHGKQIKLILQWEKEIRK
jgi:hypothetical protein